MLWFLLPGVAERVLGADDWACYRRWAWNDAKRGQAPDPARFSLPSVACPTMGVWSSDDFALAEAQMTHSERFVTGPWRYERIDDVDHWVSVHAPDQLTGCCWSSWEADLPA